jgi:hypothetical protein
MAEDDFTAGTDILLVDSGIPGAIIEAMTNDNDIKPGDIVTAAGERGGPSAWIPDIDLCGNGETPLGVVLRNPDQDLNTAYADNTIVKVARCGGHCKVQLKIIINGPNTEINEFVTGGKTAAPGIGRLLAYTDGAIATDTKAVIVGRCAKTFTLNNANHTVGEVWLDD